MIGFPLFVHLEDDPPQEIAYEVHLHPPYIPEGCENDPSKWVGHYIGSAERDRFMQRVFGDHGTPHGARVLQVARTAGCTWHLVRTWAGGRDKEAQLKQRSGRSYCPEPECSGENARPAMSPPNGHHYRTRRERREAQAARERIPRNRDGSVSRSRMDDAQLDAIGNMTREQWSAHTVLKNHEHDTGKTERFLGPPPGEDKWQSGREAAMTAEELAAEAWQPVTDTRDNLRLLGAVHAEGHVLEEANAGMTAGQIAREQDELAGWVETQAVTEEGKANASGYCSTSDVLISELQQQEREAV